MSGNWKTCSRHWRRGLTLLEVMVGLALLSTLLVGVLVAHKRHAAQAQQARRHLASIKAADELVAQWLAQPEVFPQGSSGTLSDSADGQLRWETRIVDRSQQEKFGVLVARLEVFDATADLAQPLLSLELAVLDPTWPPEKDPTLDEPTSTTSPSGLDRH